VLSHRCSAGAICYCSHPGSLRGRHKGGPGHVKSEVTCTNCMQCHRLEFLLPGEVAGPGQGGRFSFAVWEWSLPRLEASQRT
jgi:hypothetical protein